MQKIKISLCALVLLLAFSIAEAQERVEKTYDEIRSIRLTTSSGNGIIKKSSSKEVKVTLEYTYDKDSYEPKFEQNGDILYIEEDFRRSRWTDGYSKWTLEIPDGLELEFKTGSGNIEVGSVNVNLNANSGSGNIDINQVDGDVRANTGSGNITFSDLNGRMYANTGSGSIRLDHVKIQDGARFNTGSGNIRANVIEGELDMNTGSGGIDVRAATITGHSSINTGSGNAQLELVAALDFDVSINTGSGNATLDFNGQEIAGDFYMKASDKSNIRAPFKFDKEYEEDRGWRGRTNYIKEAKVGNKDIRIRVSTGSGNAVVKQ